MDETNGEQVFELDDTLRFSRNGKFWDPTVVWRKLMSDKEVNVQAEMSRIASPVAPDDFQEALEAVARVSTAAFGLKPFDPNTGEGTTESEAFVLCRDFLVWAYDLKKKLLLLPTRWQLMEHLGHSEDPSPKPNDGPSDSTGSECS